MPKVKKHLFSNTLVFNFKHEYQKLHNDFTDLGTRSR